MVPEWPRIPLPRYGQFGLVPHLPSMVESENQRWEDCRMPTQKKGAAAAGDPVIIENAPKVPAGFVAPTRAEVAQMRKPTQSQLNGVKPMADELERANPAS